MVKLCIVSMCLPVLCNHYRYGRGLDGSFVQGGVRGFISNRLPLQTSLWRRNATTISGKNLTLYLNTFIVAYYRWLYLENISLLHNYIVSASHFFLNPRSVKDNRRIMILHGALRSGGVQENKDVKIIGDFNHLFMHTIASVFLRACS